MSVEKKKSSVALPVDNIAENYSGVTWDAIYKGKLFPEEYKDLQAVVLDDKYVKVAAKIIRNVKEKVDLDDPTKPLNPRESYIAGAYSLDAKGVSELAKDLYNFEQEDKRRKKFETFMKIKPDADYKDIVK